MHQVRWSGFCVLLITLCRSLVQLHTALDTLLPLLPGSELRGQAPPPPIDQPATPWRLVSILPATGPVSSAVTVRNAASNWLARLAG